MLPATAWAQAPHQLGGFRLGADINAFAAQVDMDSRLPIRYMAYIQEVEIRQLAGFKSGLIGYGTCAEPGKVVRIKLKYADSSEDFFKSLLGQFKKRFGEPDEYRGDPFRVYIAWKWSFEDADHNRISLILSHNQQNDEEKLGNAVKLSLTNWIEKERACYLSKHPEEDASGQKGVKQRGKPDWTLFVPH